MYPDYWDEYEERSGYCTCCPNNAAPPPPKPVLWCSTPECQIKVKKAGLCDRCKIQPGPYKEGTK